MRKSDFLLRGTTCLELNKAQKRYLVVGINKASASLWLSGRQKNMVEV
jgi:hypothetical protein